MGIWRVPHGEELVATYGSGTGLQSRQWRLLTGVPVAFDGTTPWAAFTEASFPGYAPLALPALSAVYDAAIPGTLVDYGGQVWTLSADLPGPLQVLTVVLYDQFAPDWVWLDINGLVWPQTIQFAGDTVSANVRLRSLFF